MKSVKRRLQAPFTGNLRTQLMVATVAPVTALLIALTLVGAFGFTRLTQTLVRERDSELVQLAARQVAGDWAESVLLLTQIASADAVRATDQEASQTLLSANLALLDRYDQISITDPVGTVVTTDGGEVGEHVGQLGFFERTRRLRRPVRSPVYENSRGQRVISVAVPYYDVLGQFGGCTLGTWVLGGDHLGLPIDNVRVGESGFAYLVDSSGTILYHPDRSLTGESATGHPEIASLLQDGAGARIVQADGHTTVVGYAPIALRQLASSLFADETWDGWGLLTTEDWDSIVAPLEPYLRLMIVLLLLVVVLPLAFLALSGRRIVAPLQSLVEQAERVASGEFDSQVSVYSGPTEVRELELAFNAMVDQLRRYRNDIQSYVVSILNSQEEERKRVARELHDETAQALIVLGRRIETAQDMAGEGELADELESLRDMVDDTLQGVRRFTSDLRPPLLEELGLPRTLELLGARTAREEALEVGVTIVGKPSQFLPELELGLYRLAQASLSNVRRHARATHVSICLTYDASFVKLEITDDGVGFEAPSNPTDLIKSGRLGLMGIHERARLFGGRAVIESKPGQGTSVTVIIPITKILLPSE
ncbi:MAG: sensor histidine kinase [Anaerolineae bacterium]